MIIYVVEANNHETDQNYREWFIGLAFDMEDAEKCIRKECEFAEIYRDYKPITPHAVVQNKSYVWNWSDVNKVDIVDFVIWPYDFEGACKC